ncbi:MAG: hypothetical protein ACRD0W_23010 [Acidimicrobiales bacterium]
MGNPALFQGILTEVWRYVREHPGCTRSEIVAMVRGNNGTLGHAVDRLIAEGRVVQWGNRRLHCKD